MHIVSTRKTDKGSWTYFKSDDDEPRFYRADPAKGYDFADVEAVADAAAAVQEIVNDAKARATLRPTIVLFVHGFNNTVPSACKTAEVLLAGLRTAGLDAAGAALCWSSDGKITNYLQDRNDARASAIAVGRALRLFAANADIASGQVALASVTHSMGNYVLDFACEAMGIEGPALPRLFSDSVLVAADINRDDLNVGQEGDARCRLSSRVTFYYDGWDGTLEFAEFLLHRERFGKMGPHHWDMLCPNVRGVNCADVIRAHTANPIDGAVDVEVDIHSMYFAEPAFYADLAAVLSGTSPSSMPTRSQPAGSPPNAYRLVQPAK